MEEPINLSISISTRWIRQRLDKLFARRVPSSLVHEVHREVLHCIENTLTSGLSVSVGQAVSVALDVLGYMDLDLTQRDSMADIPG